MRLKNPQETSLERTEPSEPQSHVQARRLKVFAAAALLFTVGYVTRDLVGPTPSDRSKETLNSVDAEKELASIRASLASIKAAFHRLLDDPVDAQEKTQRFAVVLDTIIMQQKRLEDIAPSVGHLPEHRALSEQTLHLMDELRTAIEVLRKNLRGDPPIKRPAPGEKVV